MVEIPLKAGADVEGFRKAVRWLVAEKINPADVSWRSCGGDEELAFRKVNDHPEILLPAGVGPLAKLVVCHDDPERYGLLYSLIWRIVHGERGLLEVASDPLVHRLARMRKSVAREIHKMHAFLRFQNVATGSRERFVAWFEPQHFILDEAAPFFVSRFPSFEWSILTPIGSLHWDRRRLTAGGPASRPDLTHPQDEFEKGWVDYYRSTFNPARLNTNLMRSEMPKRYWKNMPEARAIGDMVRHASSRTEDMFNAGASVSAKRSPERALHRAASSAPASLHALNKIIMASEPFVTGGTKAVLGEGPMRPALAFVGEQPGDQEDLEGRPFVGPAGKVFDRALAASGISREQCYVTNAVKNFKYQERGKRRLHQTPTHGEIKHYRWWLQEELKLVEPQFVVALGASAAFALTGRPVKIADDRGFATFDAGPGLITIHPSFILRLRHKDEADAEFSRFVEDLASVNIRSAQLR